MNRRQKATVMFLTACVLFRVWRLSRRTGIPFQPLLDAHVETMRLKAQYYRGLVVELRQREHERSVAEIARNN